jgi:GR25 family glycosyltransferase involved in LPS biosynthesis
LKAIVINLDSRPDRYKEFQKNKFPFPVERFSGITASCGEDGCAQSHLAVITSQTEFPFIVFEDDCQLIQPWSVVEKAMNQLPADWSALWLGGNLRTSHKNSRYSDNLFKLNHTYALHAVIYNSKNMIDFIAKRNKGTEGRNIDIFYHDVVQQMFNCFIVYPLVATQRPGWSDINQRYGDYSEELIKNFENQTE